MELPKFKYHPNPIATESIEESPKQCEFCQQSRGYLYTLEIEDHIICPWCIADVSAARNFEIDFSDDRPLEYEGIKPEIIEDVCKRTPSFSTWQQEIWLTHCKDACEFHGDASKEELVALEGQALKDLIGPERISSEEWQDILEDYESGGNTIGVYKFKCRHCNENMYYMDYT